MSQSNILSNNSKALEAHHFTISFVVLALISGITIGMNKIQITLLGLHLNAAPWQIGFLSGAESLSMMLMSIPAGILIHRYGARNVYGISSIAAMLTYPLIAYAGNWYLASIFLFVAGICIPFRVVSMNTSWLERLNQIGKNKAGWYRGTLMTGIGLIGPVLGNMTTQRYGIHVSYWITSGLFALMSLIGFLILSPTVSHESTGSIKTSLINMFSDLNDSMIKEVCLFDGMGGVVRGFFGTFIIIISVRQFHWDTQVGVYLMIMEGTVFVSILFLFGSLVHKYSERLVYGLSHTALIIGLLFLGFGNGIIWLAVGAIFQAAGQAVNHLVNISRLAVSNKKKGHISGLFTMVGMAGGLVGASLGGVLSKGLGLQNVFLLWIPIWLLVTPGVRRFIFGLFKRRA